MRHRPLHDLVPGLARTTCPLNLGTFPTPVTEATALAAAWRLAGLWVKRDDLSAPEYGGAKVRALEYLLGEALVAGAPGVATLGAEGSHHVLATAVFARKLGLRCRAVVFRAPTSPETGQALCALEASGAEVIRVRTYPGIPVAWLRAVRRPLGPAAPFPVPPGGTSPLGILGAVEGALELLPPIEAGLFPSPDAILVPAGSCGTAAGILLGLALAGIRVPVVAVRVVPQIVARPGRVRRLAKASLRLIRRAGLSPPVTLGPLQWVNDLAGQGYARPTPDATQAVDAVTRLAGFRAETTYTGKTLAHLLLGRMTGRRVLFWNTFSAVDPILR